MRHHRRFLSLPALLLTACSSMTALRSDIPVSIHGVNYTDEPFRYVLVDPKDERNTGGGEHIAPFGAGGIMCCYSLPKRWSPGIQVQVHTTHWGDRNANGRHPEIAQVHTVEVPRYLDGEVGELWVLRTKGGIFDLVSSNVQPDHPAWPGKVKGWPEPSIEYRRERWELYRKLAESDVNLYRNLIKKLKIETHSHLQEMWKYDKENRPEKVMKFAGPADPDYATYLSTRYIEGLRETEARLAILLKEKP